MVAISDVPSIRVFRACFALWDFRQSCRHQMKALSLALLLTELFTGHYHPAPSWASSWPLAIPSSWPFGASLLLGSLLATPRPTVQLLLAAQRPSPRAARRPITQRATCGSAPSSPLGALWQLNALIAIRAQPWTNNDDCCYSLRIATVKQIIPFVSRTFWCLPFHHISLVYGDFDIK